MRRVETSPPATSRERRGFTFIESLATFAIAAIVAMLAAPRITQFRDRSAVRAARQELTAVLEAARTASVQRSTRSQVIISGDSARAIVDTGPPGLPAVGQRTVLALRSLKTTYGVRLEFGTPADSAIVYDSRGMANPRLARVARYVVVGRVARDSVCVASMGTILPRGCAP
jgi:prepilin-type N-terminal cleavage/methylation domain-containing protein